MQEGVDLHGGKVLSAYAPVSPLGWQVFVELPAEEAYASLYNSIKRSGLIMFGGLMLAFIAGLLLARRMVVPIQMLRAGAQRIGGGDLGQRISIKTGDELEGLADQFNDMANRLGESYASLERKVEMRTRELAQSVEELRALGEVSQAVNSTLDLQTVLDTIVAKAVQLSSTDAGTIFVFNEATDEFEVRANYGMSEDVVEALERHHAELSTWLKQVTKLRQPVQDADLRHAIGVAPSHHSKNRCGKRVISRAYSSRCSAPTDRRRPRRAPKNCGRDARKYDRSPADLRGTVGVRDPERAAVPRNTGQEP